MKRWFVIVPQDEQSVEVLKRFAAKTPSVTTTETQSARNGKNLTQRRKGAKVKTEGMRRPS